MARHCESCGGVLGQDCFNPQECVLITERERMSHQQENYQLEERLFHIEKRLDELEKQK